MNCKGGNGLAQYLGFFNNPTKDYSRNEGRHTLTQVGKHAKTEPSPDCHLEPAAKDLCPAEKAGFSEIFPEICPEFGSKKRVVR
ncbi:MAG TPA: hypothetical protein DD706_10545 [Nitrospiraceae bacterium]|nr:hypothetical protein [Nitrospiraceae bacterium]